jgi:hypothetical protein
MMVNSWVVEESRDAVIVSAVGRPRMTLNVDIVDRSSEAGRLSDG